MRTSVFLKTSLTIAAIGMAHTAHAQVQTPVRTEVKPLIGADPAPMVVPGAQARSFVQPIGDPSLWVSAADYPEAAKAEKASGLVSFVLEIDEAGSVSGCRVLNGSGSKALDKGTCSLMRRRARFMSDSNGDEATRGSWAGAVKWDYAAVATS